MHQYMILIFYPSTGLVVEVQRHGSTMHSEQGSRQQLSDLLQRAAAVVAKLEKEEMGL